MEKKSQEFSMQDALRLAKSPAGQQLAALLRQADQETLQNAMDSAKAGNYQEATQKLKEILENPQSQALLSQLGK